MEAQRTDATLRGAGAYGKAGQRDEIVNVSHAMTRPPRGRDARILCVRCPGKQLVERKQATAMLSRQVLTIDLLQTQDIGAQRPQGRTKDLGAHFKRHPGLRWQIEALQVEGRDPHMRSLDESS